MDVELFLVASVLIVIVVEGDTVVDSAVTTVLLSLADDDAISTWVDVGVGVGSDAVDEIVSVAGCSVAIMVVSSDSSVSLKYSDSRRYHLFSMFVSGSNRVHGPVM